MSRYNWTNRHPGITELDGFIAHLRDGWEVTAALDEAGGILAAIKAA